MKGEWTLFGACPHGVSKSLSRHWSRGDRKDRFAASLRMPLAVASCPGPLNADSVSVFRRFSCEETFCTGMPRGKGRILARWEIGAVAGERSYAKRRLKVDATVGIPSEYCRPRHPPTPWGTILLVVAFIVLALYGSLGATKFWKVVIAVLSATLVSGGLSVLAVLFLSRRAKTRYRDGNCGGRGMPNWIFSEEWQSIQSAIHRRVIAGGLVGFLLLSLIGIAVVLKGWV
jgi:hypothetical protein